MTTSNPFDFTKAFENFDPKAFAEKMQETFKVDMSGVSEASNKNLEFLMETNKAIVEGSRQLVERQVAMMEAGMAEASEAAKKLAESKDAGEVATKQTELLEKAYETALKNTMEISEMAKKTQEEVFEKTNARITESLAEMKAQIAKLS